MPHQHHSALHFLHNKELNELYASIAIKSFAISLIGIFIPIYLLQIGYSLASVLIFFSTVASVHALMSFFAAKVAARVGLKHTILFSIPVLIAALLGLYSLDRIDWLFYFVGQLHGTIHSKF